MLGACWRGFLLFVSVSLFGCQVLLRDGHNRTEACDAVEGFGMAAEGLMMVLLMRQLSQCRHQQPRCTKAIYSLLFVFALYTSITLGVSISSANFWNNNICYPWPFPAVVFAFCLVSTVHIGISFIMAMLCQDEYRQLETNNPSEVDAIIIISTQAVSSSDELCTICLEPCQGQIKIIPCGHRFHAECIDTWLKINNTCALCRRPAYHPSLRSPPKPL